MSIGRVVLWLSIAGFGVGGVDAQEITAPANFPPVAAPGQANVRISLTEEFANRFVARETTNAGPVRDFVLGANVSGEQKTIAVTRLDVRPSDATARFEIVLNGRTQNRTVGVTQQAAVRTRGDHRFELRKQIDFDGRQLSTRSPSAVVSPAYCNESACTAVGGVPVVGPLVNNVVLAAAEQRRPQAFQVIAQRLTSDAAPRFNDGIDEQLVEANRRLSDLRQRLVRMSLLPAWQQLRSTESCLMYEAAYGETTSQTPPLAEGRAATVHLHESAVNALLDRRSLAGAEISDAELEAVIRDALRPLGFGETSVPAESEENEPNPNRALKAPALEFPMQSSPLPPPQSAPVGLATILFADRRPLSLAFRDGRVELLLRAGFRPGLGPEIPEQDIRIPLTIHVDSDRVSIVPGEPTVTPADPDADVGLMGNFAQSVMQQQIQQRLETVTFQRTLSFPVPDAAAATLSLREAVTMDGWLSLVFD